MRKNFYLSGLFLCILALCVCGCGGGSAADPMGTATVQFVSESGSVTTSATVSPGGSITLLAKVTNLRSDGTAVPVVNEKVSFSLISSGNGGGVSVVNDRTASGGQAMAVYTAGNNMASDTVRVTTDGSGSTATITITKTGGIVGARIALSASSATVVARQLSIITAKVTDGNSNPMQYETVTFTLPVNNSGASFVSSVSVTTDASGNAVATYLAGSNDSFTEVYDTVQGALANGSSSVVVITRSAETPPTELSVSVAASPTSVSAGQVSIVTATVTGDDNAGVTVTFSLPVNNSGASLSASSAVTDGSGNAVVTYRAGSNNPMQTVTDTVRAAVGSISSSAAITRTGLGALSIAVVAEPNSVSAGQVSIVTATLTGDDNVGVTVTFSLLINNSGATLSPSTAVTDGSGNAQVTYQPGANSPTIDVQDTVKAAVGSVSSIAVITRTGTGSAGYTVTLTSPGDFIGGWTGKTVSGILTATVKDSLSRNLSGVTVTFTIESGGGTLSSATAVTDGSGKAVTTYTRPVVEPAGTVIWVNFKAKIPDGTETIAQSRIDA